MLAEVLLVLAALMVATVGQWMVFDQTAPFFRAFEVHDKHEWLNRTTATVATTLIVLFSLLSGHTTLWGTAGAVAYFLHDIGHMLMYETDITMYIHHVFSLTVTGLMRMTMDPVQGASVALATAVLESTSPVTNLSWLFSKAGYRTHPAFKYLAAFMVVFFGVMRCGVFPWVMAKKMDKVTAAVFSPFLGLNLFWFYKLVKLAMKVAGIGAGGASSSEQSHEA